MISDIINTEVLIGPVALSEAVDRIKKNSSQLLAPLMSALIDLWLYLMLRSQQDLWSVQGRLFAVWHPSFHLKPLNSLCVTFTMTTSSIMHAPQSCLMMNSGWHTASCNMRAPPNLIFYPQLSAVPERSAANPQRGNWKNTIDQNASGLDTVYLSNNQLWTHVNIFSFIHVLGWHLLVAAWIYQV